MPTIYRVEHGEYGTGPWNTPQASYLISHHWHNDLWGDAIGCWYAFNDDPLADTWYFSVEDHAAIHRFGSTYMQALCEGWRVGCVTMRDLRHWFGSDTLALNLHYRGYVLRAYQTPDNNTLKAPNQCLFNPATATLISTQSTLETPL